MSRREGPTDGSAPGGGASLPRSLVALPGAALDRLESERACVVVLGAAMAASAGLGLWLTRGTTFFIDEVTYFLGNRGFDPKALLSPHNGHLVAVPRLIYAAVFKVFGADYLVFRLLEVLGVALVAGLFYALARRRVGAAGALAPSVMLLFLGSAWVVTLTPLGITHVYSVAAGFGALLMLERGGRVSDAAGCALLTISVATFSAGLAFLAGIAVSVLLRDDRRRRAWIFAIPLAGYAAWYFAAPKLHGPEYLSGTGFKLSNALLIPSFVADAASSLGAAVTGLSYNFSSPGIGDVTYPNWGVVVAALAAAALVLRVRRGNVPVSLWTSLTVLVGFWAATALVVGRVGLGDTPFAGRYVYTGAAVAFLVVADAVWGKRPSRNALAILVAATIFALAGNIALLRDGSGTLRSYSASLRSQLTGLLLARDRVAPNYVPAASPLGFVGAEGAGPLLAAVDRNGSFAFSLPELRARSESDRQVADAVMAGAEQLRLSPATAPRNPQTCRTIGANRAGQVSVVIRPPGARIRSSAPAPLTLGRFGAIPTVRAGLLAPGRFEALSIPRDRAPQPWRGAVPVGTRLTVCALGAG